MVAERLAEAIVAETDISREKVDEVGAGVAYPMTVRPGGLLTCVVCCLLVAACAGALAPAAFGWEFVKGPPKVESAPWHPLLEAGNSRTHVLGLSISSGFCVGEPPPRFAHVKVIERPKTARYPSKSAVVTAYVRFPAPTEVVGEVGPGEPRPACGGIGVTIFKRIKLKRAVEGLALYDGSFSPPRRVRP